MFSSYHMTSTKTTAEVHEGPSFSKLGQHIEQLVEIQRWHLRYDGSVVSSISSLMVCLQLASLYNLLEVTLWGDPGGQAALMTHPAARCPVERDAVSHSAGAEF